MKVHIGSIGALVIAAAFLAPASSSRAATSAVAPLPRWEVGVHRAAPSVATDPAFAIQTFNFSCTGRTNACGGTVSGLKYADHWADAEAYGAPGQVGGSPANADFECDLFHVDAASGDVLDDYISINATQNTGLTAALGPNPSSTNTHALARLHGTASDASGDTATVSGHAISNNQLHQPGTPPGAGFSVTVTGPEFENNLNTGAISLVSRLATLSCVAGGRAAINFTPWPAQSFSIAQLQ
jgi:hypothetical protein